MRPSRFSPLIGITANYRLAEGTSPFPAVSLSVAYARSVAEVGGLPVVVPVLADVEKADAYVKRLDGIVFSGGTDVPPEAYGQDARMPQKVMPEERYRFERRLIERWVRSDKPFLAVCLGLQFVNVVLGGTLIQDIPACLPSSRVAHRVPAPAFTYTPHEVTIRRGSLLRRILKADRATVLSSHHQAVAEPGRGMTITARSEDGVIEAMELRGHPFGLMIQWHPEVMTDAAHRKALFGALVDASRRNRAPRAAGL